METLMQFGINLLLCTAGLIGYALYSVRNHMHDFDWSIFIRHNKVFWVWSLIAQSLYAFVMAYLPQLEHWLSLKIVKVLEAATVPDLGIPEDLARTVVYLTLAWQLSRITNISVNKSDKIGPKKTT